LKSREPLIEFFFILFVAPEKASSNKSIMRLLEAGLPDLSADLSVSTAHIHENLDDVTSNEREFGLIGENVDSCITNKSETSQFLLDTASKSSVDYVTEGDVETHVYNYVKDIIRGLSLELDIDVHKGIEIVRLKPDLWLLMTKNKIPILAIEVKKPLPGILENPKVIAQLTQYMKLYRNFRGMCQVFGILTTFTEWKIIWLPDCDLYASSRSIDNSTTFEASDEVIVKNEVSGTRTLQGNDPIVHHYIASVILKAFYSTSLYAFQPLSIERRLVVCANDTMLTWKRANWKDGDQFIFNLPNETTKNFYLLEDLSYGAHGRLWIATSPTTSSNYCVFVIKSFSKTKKKSLKRSRDYDQRDVEEATTTEVLKREVKCWRTLGFSYRRIIMCKGDVLLMPFAITALSCKTWNVEFFHKIKTYMDGALVNLISSYVEEHAPEKVARIAIKSLSDAKILHEDIKWEHVAVVPVYVTPSLFARLVGRHPHYELRPSFIDFGKSKFMNTSAEARQKMEQSLAEIMLRTNCERSK
jgi:hypothetical protein